MPDLRHRPTPLWELKRLTGRDQAVGELVEVADAVGPGGLLSGSDTGLRCNRVERIAWLDGVGRRRGGRRWQRWLPRRCSRDLVVCSCQGREQQSLTGDDEVGVRYRV